MAKASVVYSDRVCGQCDPTMIVPPEEVNENPFGSFAPEHENSHVKFLVDGKETFAEMAEAIENAKLDVGIFLFLLVRHRGRADEICMGE